LAADYRVQGVRQQQATQVVHWAQRFITMIQEEVSCGTDHSEKC
jgi:hypothetical protein